MTLSITWQHAESLQRFDNTLKALGSMKMRQAANRAETSDHRQGFEVSRSSPQVLIYQMSAHGGKAAWLMKQPGQDAYGKPNEREVDGFNNRSCRPRPGAYRKYRLTGDVAGLAIDRFRRTVWALAVRHVAQKVAGRLSSHELTAEVSTITPWTVRSAYRRNNKP